MTNQLLVLMGWIPCVWGITFHLLLLRPLFVFGFWQFDDDVSSQSLWVHFFLEFAAFGECADECFSSNLGGFWLFFLQIFFASFYCFSFYKIFSMHMLVCLMMSCRPFSLLCLRLDNINWPVFKFSDSLARSILLLSPSREYYT